MSLLLVDAQLFSILLFIMFILVLCHDTVVSCFAVTISHHDFIVSRFAISLMWPSAPLVSRADVGGTISSGVEGTLGIVEGTLGGVEGTLGGAESTLGSVEGILVDLQSASATTATDARAPALSLHRVEWQSGALGIWMRRWGLIVSGSRVVRASHRAGCRHRRSPLRRAYVPGRWSCP